MFTKTVGFVTENDVEDYQDNGVAMLRGVFRRFL